MENESSVNRGLRRLLFGVIVLWLAGMLLDLVLLGHYEDSWQVIPLALLGLGLAVCGWHGFRPTAASLRTLQGTMFLLAAAGLLGIYLHFDGNREFQLEMDPSQSGWALFLKVIQAHAPSALAPAALVLLALLGFVYSYRHPALTPADARL